MLLVKRLLFLLFVYLAATSFAFAQENEKSTSQKSEQAFEVQTKGNNLLLSWTIQDADSGYWEVQASKDGLEFVTIGLVIGEHPVTKKSYLFKQSTAKLDKRFKFVRIQQIATDHSARTSASKKLTI